MTVNEEELSYEDRKKWFRYHMYNSKVNEENVWKQMNEMIRMKINRIIIEEMSANQNNLYPKSCNSGCNTQIYWNSSVNEYWEVFTKKKHICPNRSSNAKPTKMTAATTNNTKPTYYKTPWSSQQQPKRKMSNSFEYLQGSITEIQKKYEILSDIVTVYDGKVHGSQRDRS